MRIIAGGLITGVIMARQLRWERVWIYGLALGALIAASSPAAAAAPACVLPGQKEVLIARLYFGENIVGRKPLTDEEWHLFLSKTVTPRFPAGFTIYDAYGQWMSPNTHAIGRENTRVVEIAAENASAVRKNISAVADSYRRQFKQESVGIVTSIGCAAF
jgi:hypothetical protein